MKHKRIPALLLAILTVLMLSVEILPASAAASPTVEMLNGTRTVFVTSFGKLSYDGASHPAYKTMTEGIAALGAEGGQVIFTGTQDMTNFVDLPGRGMVNFIGVGNTITGSILSYKEGVSAVSFTGGVSFDNCVIAAAEGIPVHTNGYPFSTTSEFDSERKSTYIASGNTRTDHPHPFIFSVGPLTDGSTAAKALLRGGYYDTVAGGVIDGESAKVNTRIQLENTTVTTAVAGNSANGGTYTGNAELTILSGGVENAVAGTLGGTVDGNVTLNIAGGTIGKLTVGAAGGKITGSVVCRVTDGSIVEIEQPGNVGGKIIFIDAQHRLSADDLKFDYFISVDGADVIPVFDGTTLSGFRVTDENGFIPSTVTVNGSALEGANGVYQIPAGKSTVTCVSDAKVIVNKDASYVAGYEDGTFRPQNNMTRAEAITLLSRILCADISKLPSIALCEYNDVAGTDWYAGVIGFFQKLGFLEKLETNGGTAINPKANITRGEFAELCVNVISTMYNGKRFGVKPFDDVPATSPYYDAIGQLGYLEIIGGYEDGTFRENNSITRAEVVTIVNRFLGRAPTGNAGNVSFSDITDHWAASQIITACNPATCGENVVWTRTEDITKGNYKLLEGAGVTVGDQISSLYEQSSTLSLKDMTQGIDDIAKWQIKQIVTSPSDYPTTGNCFYISPNGDDANDGTSPEKAWKTLNRLAKSDIAKIVKAGDSILFERGGEWRGKLNCVKGVTYSAYGEGAKPIINASTMNYARENLWQETDVPNVWKCVRKLNNPGIIVYDYTGELGNYHENVGFLQVIGANGFTGYKDLTKDGTFCCPLGSGALYVYSKYGNPGTRYKSIEIGECANMCSVKDDVTLDNLVMHFTGAHAVGIGGLKNVTVKNCIFDYLGGSILQGYNGANVTRYGNALQVYGECDGWYLLNNWMYQIYDTGVTHQYTPTTGKCVMNDVKYIGNVIELCHWSIEYYNRDSTDGSQRLFKDTEIRDNICRLNGYGWGSQIRMSSSTLFQSAYITKNTENFKTYNNIFDRSAGQIFNINSDGDRKLELSKNIYVQNIGGKVGTFFGTTATAGRDAEHVLEANGHDSTSILLLNNDTSINDYILDDYKLIGKLAEK